MRFQLFIFIIADVLSFSAPAHAQKDVQFSYGNISIADFNPTVNSTDSDAKIVYLANIEKVHFEKNEAGDFDIVHTRFMRIKISKSSGLEAGQFSLYLSKLVPFRSFLMTLPKPGLIYVKGVTCNLENGIIQKIRLDPNDVYSTTEGKLTEVKKFAMPGLKEGSVFDVEYSYRSAFQIQNIDWSFQNRYPCLWSEYDLELPDANRYSIQYRGDSSFYIHTVDTGTLQSNSYSNSEKILTSHFRWVKINEGGIADEPYTSSLNNYVDRITFNYDWGYRFRPKNDYYSLSSWQGFSHIYFTINGLNDFSNEKNNWLNKELREITADCKTKKETIQALYHYVRDHFVCVYSNAYFTTQPLDETFKEKKGNVADINILLAAMLRQEKIQADPAVLSTTDNGFASLKTPIPREYNYMICVVRLEGQTILLDASRPLNPYGKLQPDCYNGGAILLHSDSPRFVLLNPDSVIESNRTNVIITSDNKGLITGSMTMICGSDKSYVIRDQIKKNSFKEYFQKEIAAAAPDIREISNEEMTDLENPDKQLTVHCDFDFKDGLNADVFYFSPVLSPFLKVNPFNSGRRKFLIEMPYKTDNVYLETIDIPVGYRVEATPASESYHLNTYDGSFDYILEKNAESIQLQIRMKLNKTIFTPEEYPALRDFFNAIIKKENEKIIFKKIR